MILSLTILTKNLHSFEYFYTFYRDIYIVGVTSVCAGLLSFYTQQMFELISFYIHQICLK